MFLTTICFLKSEEWFTKVKHTKKFKEKRIELVNVIQKENIKKLG